MIKINLLPWREELRKEKQQAFTTALSIAVGVTVCIFGGIHFQLANQQDYQTQRNKMLQDEITVLDQKIVDIKSIEEQKTRSCSDPKCINAGSDEAGFELSRRLFCIWQEPATRAGGICTNPYC